MQIVDHSRPVTRLVGRGPGIDIVHSVSHSIVEKDCDLAGRGSHGLGLADARRKSPVKGAERGVGASDGDGSKAQKCGRPAAGSARMPSLEFIAKSFAVSTFEVTFDEYDSLAYSGLDAMAGSCREQSCHFTKVKRFRLRAEIKQRVGKCSA